MNCVLIKINRNILGISESFSGQGRASQIRNQALFQFLLNKPIYNMNVLQLINQMQPLDCVRSGALIFGMVAILIASNRAKSNNRKWDSVGIWLFGDSIGLGLFALGLYLFPTQVLQYEVRIDGCFFVYI